MVLCGLLLRLVNNKLPTSCNEGAIPITPSYILSSLHSGSDEPGQATDGETRKDVAGRAQKGPYG